MFLFPKDIKLADEQFNKPKGIDVLLGANIFYDLLKTGQIKLSKNMPVLQETVSGWIISGNLSLHSNFKNHSQKFTCNFIQENEMNSLNDTLVKFWQIEELPKKQMLSREAQFCESYFTNTTIRNSENRFVVKLPFVQNVKQQLANSKEMCKKRFLNMESRLNRNEHLKLQYINFMKEYENLNHMTLKCSLDEDNSHDENSYFLPHHPVLRESSLTTQCRIVFDASFKTSNETSLNDLLCLGHTVQEELFSIILRFLLRSVVLNSDIRMMYRQILVDLSDRSYQ